VETRLKGYKYFEIERDFFNKLGVLIDGDFKFGVLLLVKIEVDPKEQASVVEVFQDVLDKLSDGGKKDKLLKFFKLVQDGKFPLNNIAFELFSDIVQWFDKDESRQIFDIQCLYIDCITAKETNKNLFGVEDSVKMSLSFFGPDINRMKRPSNNFLPNQKKMES
jgi:hypothetical protein